MSAIQRQSELPPLLVANWQADVTALLDEHHLAAWSDLPQRRTQFAVSLGQFLGTQRDTEVCVFYGKFITDLESFCYQLERAVPGPSLERAFGGDCGITNLLRARASIRGRPESKYRFYIWHDADVLLRHDKRLFAQIVDAMAGVAAEAEYVSDDLLLIHRSVLVGSSLLDVYAEDERSQFNAWLRDAEGDPYWQVVTGLARPPFMRYRIDALSHAVVREHLKLTYSDADQPV
jgi:hypothetical protein